MLSVTSFNGRRIRASTFRLTGLGHDGLRQRKVTLRRAFWASRDVLIFGRADVVSRSHAPTTGRVLRPAEGKMADQVQWQLSGDYFENCSCSVVCPCLVSKAAPLSSKPTEGVCNVPLVFHIESGREDGITVLP